MMPLKFQTPAAAVLLLAALGAMSGHAHADDAALPSPAELAAAHPGKLVYLDFWASWCVPCRKTFPFMNSLESELADTVKVIAVNVDADAEQAAAFLDAFPADFEILYDPEGSLAEAMNLKGMPSSYLIGPDGELLGQHVGFRSGDEQKVREQIDKAVAELLP